MKVFKNLASLPNFKNAVITIGSFDGVHSGHQKIIERVKQLAQSIDGESVLITFHPHPRLIIYPKDNSLKLITTIEEKVQRFEQYGIDNVIILPFTIEFSQLSADEYIQNFLVKQFHPKYIVIGYDHRFGLNRQGDISYLKWYGKEAEYEVIEIEKQEVDDMAISSTKIRKALEHGDVSTAHSLLGHYFTLTGTVAKGQQIGKTIGFPTANISISEKHKLIPPDGIYAAWVYHHKQKYGGMLYIGRRPTLKEYTNRTIEVNIFDFNQEIYGEELQLELIDFIREDAQFEALDQLKSQLKKDQQAALKIIKKSALVQAKKKTLIPSIAIVILNYNGKDFLEKFLPSITATNYSNLSIYIADNQSTDDSIKFIKNQYPNLNLIALPINHGFAGGYNEALKQIDTEYYILLNSDIEVTSGWIDPIIERMQTDRELAACQPKIKAHTNQQQFEYAGAAGGWIDTLGYPFCRGRIFDQVEEDHGQYDDPQEVFWATGAAFFVKAAVFRNLGGFDANYFAHSEEIDLCWRIKRAGYKIMVIPQSVVYHVGGGTLDYQSPQKTYLNFRNNLITLLKNVSVAKLLWLIPMRLILDGIAGLLFLTEGKFEHIWSILRAHGSFYKSFFSNVKKRQEYNQLIKEYQANNTYNTQGLYKGSIVWQYYIRKKRRFSDLFKQMTL